MDGSVLVEDMHSNDGVGFHPKIKNLAYLCLGLRSE